MAYSTGAPASCVAVLQALATFCTSYGWTVNYNNTYTGLAWWLSVSKGSCYLNFTVPTGDGKINLYGATGYSGASAPTAQPGISNIVTTNPGKTSSGVNPGPYSAYHFFSSSSGTYLHCLIEVSSGIFAHIHGGSLVAAGGASPAIYVTGSNWSNYAPQTTSDTAPSSPDQTVNMKPFTQDSAQGSYGGPSAQLGCTVDGTFRWFASVSASSPSRLRSIGNSSGNADAWSRRSHQRSPNTFNGLSVLSPIPFFAERSAGNIYSMIGDAPDVRFFNMTNNNAKDEITIGSDVWKVFPIISNNPTINTANAPASSYPYGLAFKKSA